MSNRQKRQSGVALSTGRIVTVAGLILILSIVSGLAVLAQVKSAFVKQVREIDTTELDISNPAGLVFSPAAGVFYVVEARQPGQPPASFSDVAAITPVQESVGALRLPTAISEPINMAFDGKANRLLLYQPTTRQLMAIAAGPDGQLDPKALTPYSAARFGLQNPQGMTVDPVSGALFILDSAGPQFVTIKPGPDGGFEDAAITRVSLAQAGLSGLQGLAFNPANGNLYTLSPAGQTLYELTQTGRVEASRDLSTLGLDDPQGMVFAPSGDLTDDPAQMSLYIADSGLSGASGRIVELSFTSVAAPEVATVVATLVNTIDTSLLSPPSPDPTGVTYLDDSGTLVFCDSEVDETPIFADVNVWEVSLTGILVDTFDVTSITDEPAGCADKPNAVPTNRRLYFTDDDNETVYIMSPGPDGAYGTGDDSIDDFSTSAFGSNDPEDLAYDNSDGTLWIVDGVNAEVYHVRPGINGQFDGVPPAGDDQVTSFDMLALGLEDLSGVAYDPLGYLYVTGQATWDPGERYFAHVTRQGVLVRWIDAQAAALWSMTGVEVAPGSSAPSQMHVYLTDRGKDPGNYPDPADYNDGKIRELSIPLLPAYALDVAPPTATAAGNPGAQVVYTLRVTNIGRNADTYNVTLRPGYTWAPTFPATVGPLSPGASADVQISVPVPANALCTNSDTATIRFTSLGSSGTYVQSALTTTVNTIRGVSVEPPASTASGNPGAQVPYTLQLTNSGNCADTFNVTKTGNLWTTNVQATVGPVNPGQTSDVPVAVTVPQAAQCADVDTATITFTSQASAGTLDWSSLITSANQVPPVAIDDAYSALDQLVVAAPGVLGNDTAGNCGALTATLVSLPLHGTVVLNADGSFTYTGAPRYAGPDSFTYAAHAGALQDPATVTLTVTSSKHYVFLPLVTKEYVP